MSQYGLFLKSYWVHVRPGAYIPRYNDIHDAAAEIRSPEDITLEPGEKKQVYTGLHFKMPTVEHVQMLVPAKQMLDREVMLFDSNRLIDTWDGGELMVTLWNTSQEQECVINAGDVIAKITVILNSHGSYVTSDYNDVVVTEMEDWVDPESEDNKSRVLSPDDPGPLPPTPDVKNNNEKDSWTFK